MLAINRLHPFGRRKHRKLLIFFILVNGYLAFSEKTFRAGTAADSSAAPRPPKKPPVPPAPFIFLHIIRSYCLK
jgi:hypothetical protein